MPKLKQIKVSLEIGVVTIQAQVKANYNWNTVRFTFKYSCM